MPRAQILRLFITVSAMSVVSSFDTRADEAGSRHRDFVKVAAVQISGYDKGDVPREGYEPTIS